MVFRGGPKDGEETETEEGWPAPGGCDYPDSERAGVIHKYIRVDTVEKDGQVHHIYDYRGER